MATGGLCVNCANSLWCGTWTQWKCTALMKRVRDIVENCPDYKRRDKNFKERPCQCEDCMANAEIDLED